MFKISIVESFESRVDEIISFPTLETWDNLPEENIQTVTDIRKTPAGFWLACTGVGAIEIDCEHAKILAYPAKETPMDRFEYYLFHNWLPLAYQACGVQVIHASAVVHHETHNLIIFCGESGSGKSTLAYGLGQRSNWQQIADDRLAFSIEVGFAVPHFIPDNIKLRPESAKYFNQKAFSFEEINWLSKEIQKIDVYIIDQENPAQKRTSQSFSIHRLTKAEAYPKLLKQAFSLSPGLKDLNKNIIQDYLVIAGQVATYNLKFSKEFYILEEILNYLNNNIIQDFPHFPENG